MCTSARHIALFTGVLAITGASAALTHATPAVRTARALPALAATNPCGAQAWTRDGDQADGRFGTVAPAGDVNGDGFDDVLVGAYNYDHPEVDEGVVFVYLGSAAGLDTLPVVMLEVNQAGAHLGDKLSGAGDVNGDGYDDIVVGAGLYDHGETDEGAAFLFLGGPSGPAATPSWMVEGDQLDAELGACVQGAGDVNADGYDDVIVGAWLYDGGQTNEGRALVYLGSATGLATTPAWTGESNTVGAVYGYFCTGAGDLNHDGFGDIAVGARRYNVGNMTSAGKVYVYLGSSTGPSLAPDWTFEGDQTGGEVGSFVEGTGDVNGDGFGDLLVGAFRYDHPERDEGRAWLFEGTATGLSLTPAWTGESDQRFANYSYHLDGAGDFNHDGYADVILSASELDADTLVDAGRVYVYAGSAAGLETTPAWTFDGDQTGCSLEAVRGVGDVNSDGFSDFAVGTLYHDEQAGADAGRAYVFYGCPYHVLGVAPDVAEAPRIAVVGPNPARGAITLAFSMPASGRARVSVFDVSGRLVVEVVDGRFEAGRHAVEWNRCGERGEAVSAGVYFVRLEVGGVTRVARVVALR